jgi:hypothetical protein
MGMIGTMVVCVVVGMDRRVCVAVVAMIAVVEITPVHVCMAVAAAVGITPVRVCMAVAAVVGITVVVIGVAMIPAGAQDVAVAPTLIRDVAVVVAPTVTMTTAVIVAAAMAMAMMMFST